MAKHTGISRRTFLAGTAAAAATSCATSGKKPSIVRANTVSPNSKLNIAAIGCGGKGEADTNGCRDENIVALCDVDSRRAGQTFERWPDARRFSDFREMLDKMGNEIDAVTVTTPDHTHAVAAIAAIQMGIHVHVQKPLTHSIFEARVLRDAAKKYNVVTQMGNQGHSNNGVRQLCEMVWSGVIGEVKECHIWTNRPVWPQGLHRPSNVDSQPADLNWDAWLGPMPQRPFVSKHPETSRDCYHPFVWRGWWDFGCGALGDMACHIADPPNWALKLGYPDSVEVVNQEGQTGEMGPLKSTLKFKFPAREDQPECDVYWYDGGNLPPRPEGIPAGEKIGDGNNGSMFIGDKGVISAGEYGGNPRLHPDNVMADYTMPNETIPRIKGQNSYKDWINGCKGEGVPCSNFEYSAPFTEWVLLGNLALRTGRSLEWDGEAMEVTNFPEANQFVKCEYRRGWDLTY
jgi:predicted dehydrogenase